MCVQTYVCVGVWTHGGRADGRARGAGAGGGGAGEHSNAVWTEETAQWSRDQTDLPEAISSFISSTILGSLQLPVDTSSREI